MVICYFSISEPLFLGIDFLNQIRIIAIGILDNYFPKTFHFLFFACLDSERIFFRFVYNHRQLTRQYLVGNDKSSNCIDYYLAKVHFLDFLYILLVPCYLSFAKYFWYPCCYVTDKLLSKFKFFCEKPCTLSQNLLQSILLLSFCHSSSAG